MQPPRFAIYIPLILCSYLGACERETPAPDLGSNVVPEGAGTPTFHNKSLETLPPYTEIYYGPDNAQTWGPNVEFKWAGFDDDGKVVSYEYMWTNDEQYNWEFGEGPVQSMPDLIAWIDTLTYRPDGPGSYSDELIWKSTVADSVVLLDMPVGGNYYFAVRSIDNLGEKEASLENHANVRTFAVSNSQDGPRIEMQSNIAGTWSTSEPAESRGVFAEAGLHFTWFGSPGPSGADVAGYSYAVDDSSNWNPFSLENVEYPVQIPGDPEELWFPDPGVRQFFVRAIDAAGFVRTLVATVEVFAGPASCPPQNRYVLAVLDTDPASIMDNEIWPPDYRAIERTLVEYLLDGYNFQIHETHGFEPPRMDQLDCASSTIWLHSADPMNNDSSVLLNFHRPRPSSNQPVLQNPLPSYIQSGGNFFLCGIQPVNALRYFEEVPEGPELVLQFPIDFCSTLDNSDFIPHWVATKLGVCRVEDSITQSLDLPVLSLASSQVTGGANPYPDLPFDPLSFPNGLDKGGFRYFDTGIEPTSEAEVIYTDAATGEAIGIRKLTSPGVNGNTIYLGFHPYFIEKSTFREFLHAALSDFGEVPTR